MERAWGTGGYDLGRTAAYARGRRRANASGPARARTCRLHLRRRRARRNRRCLRRDAASPRSVNRRTPADLRAALAQTIVGQGGVLDALLLALLSNGHVRL